MTQDQAILELTKTFDINAIYAYRVFLQANKNILIEDAKKIIGSRPKPFVKWEQFLKNFLEYLKKVITAQFQWATPKEAKCTNLWPTKLWKNS
ncbi:hypothetical protein GW765_02080 [Candidatus Parcubacteria bacterium]|uniref:Uncharacterized protein n=1 Tax=Candidatus Uhrbacteria bacterium CG_4_9_14_3_um_filter_41_35 TaxID=1975034 RepID=A0A2M7XED9_9BACT|nr:hypothetical protein [Candidatus Parcubacteria bacterium]PIQ67510.1 MAG: hypothetical protein COV92_02510 [Candidatus Uhrbacteria bacterium CG11_big_fil_rev_8_21_14_0_20_41_9]PIZ54161.1 MAG: hypothetical protein COY25_02395 [Candidatus Uhrbacteria bacterium CG_4_10_14_0_2_um_filter_41_7]PJA46249.1 MAG: hypothetical protein CO173_03280 [Candidatus Uhrbacteria bacterium CG_4_9_14_3_um_filter_41_35]